MKQVDSTFYLRFSEFFQRVYELPFLLIGLLPGFLGSLCNFEIFFNPSHCPCLSPLSLLGPAFTLKNLAAFFLLPLPHLSSSFSIFIHYPYLRLQLQMLPYLCGLPFVILLFLAISIYPPLLQQIRAHCCSSFRPARPLIPTLLRLHWPLRPSHSASPFLFVARPANTYKQTNSSLHFHSSAAIELVNLHTQQAHLIFY